MYKKLVVFPLLASCSLFSIQAKTIKYPVCDFRSSCYENITEVELTDTETKVHVLCTCPPGFTVNFVSKLYLQDPVSGKKWSPTGIEGARFDTEVAIPADGDSSFVLIFPALDQTVKKVDYVGTDVKLYGVSLEKGRPSLEVETTVPPQVNQWLNQELAKAKNKTLQTKESFFCRDSARIVGYIKGYDPRAGFTTGELIFNNAISNESAVFAVEIEPDGRFHVTIPLIHPVQSAIGLLGYLLNFYLEPGQTLAMIVDWEDLLIACRQDSQNVKNIEYRGPTAKICTELNGMDIKRTDNDRMKTLSPNDYKAEEQSNLKENMDIISNMEQTGSYHPKTIEILKNKATLASVYNLMQYGESKNPFDYATGKKVQNVLPADYYNFLKDYPLNNPGLMCFELYNFFLNDFEFMADFRDLGNESNLTLKGFINYLEEDRKVQLTQQEKKAFNNTPSDKTSNSKLLEQMQETNWAAFIKKHQKEYDDYNSYVQALMERSLTDSYLTDWNTRDANLVNQFNMKPNLAFDILKMRSIPSLFMSRSTISKSASYYYMDSLTRNIEHPFLKEEAIRFMEDYYKKNAKGPSTLDVGKASQILKEIIQPFQGKMLLVDFWSTSCGPCKLAINTMKNLRARNLNNKNFAFLFITDEVSSPIGPYERFVKDQNLVNSFRISHADFTYITDFFKFNAVPHYMLIDAKGRIVDDDYHEFKSKSEMKKYLN